MFSYALLAATLLLVVVLRNSSAAPLKPPVIIDPEPTINTKAIVPGAYEMTWETPSPGLKYIEITFKTSFSWIGFGLAEPSSGTMMGADILTMHTSRSKGALIQDRYATKEGEPALDCQQDWELLEYQRNDGMSTFRVRRLLNTDDTQDHAFIDNGFATRLIAAWGASNTEHADGISYHGENRKLLRVNFFSPDEMSPLNAVLANPDVSTIVLAPQNFTVPAQTTTYKDFFFKISDLEAGFSGDFALNNSYIVAIDEFIVEKYRKNVHHLVLSGYYGTAEGGECSGQPKMLWLWASGSDAFVMPKDVGFAFGVFKCFHINTHYDNPGLSDTIVDSSGAKVYIQSKAPAYEAGVMVVGDPQVKLFGQNLPVGYSQYEFLCDTDNIDGKGSALPMESLIFFKPVFHMHKSGSMMRTQIYRNNSLIHQNRVDYYDFDYQTSLDVAPYVLKRGDQLRTTCTYYNDGSENIMFGLESHNEMCMDFLFYYTTSGNHNGGTINCGILGTPETEQFLVKNGTTVQESELGRVLKTEICPTTTPTTATTAAVTVVKCSHEKNLRHGEDCDQSAGPGTQSITVVIVMSTMATQLFW